LIKTAVVEKVFFLATILALTYLDYRCIMQLH